MDEKHLPQPVPQARSAAVVIESHRAVAEAIAARQVAMANPRNPVRAQELIISDCSMLELAEEASYDYARGGSGITGPTIRLLETIARRWGNIECGVKVLGRQDGMSEVMTYAIDLETGFQDKKVFPVRHWRDTKRGGYAVTDERDIYEVEANFAARRKRACLEAIIPPDVKDAAIRQCEITLKSKIEITPDFIKSVVESFEKWNVTQEMIEKRIQRKISSMSPGHAISLRKIMNSLKENMSEVRDWFELPGEGAAAPAGTKTDNLAAELAGRKKPPPAPAAEMEETGEITNTSIRKAIVVAGSQDALTPLMFDIMKLTQGQERDETMRLWNAKVVSLKGPVVEPKAEPKPAATKARPNGTNKIKTALLEKMSAAKTKDDLDTAASEITLHAWDADDQKELEKRYQQCLEDINL